MAAEHEGSIRVTHDLIDVTESACTSGKNVHARALARGLQGRTGASPRTAGD